MSRAVLAAAAALLLLGATGPTCDSVEVHPIGPHAFRPLGEDEPLFALDYAFANMGAGCHAFAPVLLPAGRRITRVEVRASRLGGTVTGRLVEVDESGHEALVAPVSGTTSNNSTSGLLTLDATYDAPIAADRWYALRVTTDADGLQLVGARVSVSDAVSP